MKTKRKKKKQKHSSLISYKIWSHFNSLPSNQFESFYVNIERLVSRSVPLLFFHQSFLI